MIELPPPLWIPERPAIIRPEIAPLRYFPVDLNRGERRSIYAELRRAGRVGAMLPGMFPVLAFTYDPGSVPPAIVNYGTGFQTTNSGVSSVSAGLPASIVAGNLLLMFVGVQQSTFTMTVNTPSGWTMVANDIGPGQLRRVAVFYKIATGSEGASVSVSGSRSGWWNVVTVQIESASSVEASVIATGTSANAASGTLTPSWGNKTALWFSAVAGADGSVPASPTPPSGYGDVQNKRNSNIGTNLIVANKLATASSETPGAWVTGSTQWGAYTVAVS